MWTERGEQRKLKVAAAGRGSEGRVSYFIKLESNSHDGCQALVWEIVYKYELKLISLHSALHQLHLTGPLPLRLGHRATGPLHNSAIINNSGTDSHVYELNLIWCLYS